MSRVDVLRKAFIDYHARRITRRQLLAVLADWRR